MLKVMKGAKILIESLLKENVELVFGYPGGAVLDIYDELLNSSLKHYLTRHEQGAIHAADGYARSTGKVGVCFATSGPGCTNLVTGLATAYRDSIPLVAITGQVSTAMIGKDSFQEADIRNITASVTKHNYLITDVTKLAKSIKEAFHIASTGRPGPVLIDIPDDISRAETEFHYPKKVHLTGYSATYQGHSMQIMKAAEEINKAERLVLFCGGGVISSGATPEVRQLVEEANIPVITSLMGIGGFPNRRDPLSLGMPGLFGTRAANHAITEAEVLIAVGARFSNRVTGLVDLFAPKAKIIHIDIDPAEIGKNVNTDIPIVGDIKTVLQKLIPLIKETKRDNWIKQVQQWKKDFNQHYQQVLEDPVKPQFLLDELNKFTQGEAITVTEVGQHQMWAANYCDIKNPRHFLSSGGLGTMGFGFPASLGAQIGNPGKKVVLIAGDGSFQMNIQEMATLKTYDLPVKIIILNNGCLGMVKQYQEYFYGSRFSQVDLSGPDYPKLANAYGVPAARIEKAAEVNRALTEMFAEDSPFLLEVLISREENVFPMVAPGAGLTGIIGG